MITLPDNFVPILVAIFSLLGFATQAYLNRKERREEREKAAAQRRDIVADTLRHDYDRIKDERDECRRELKYWRRLGRRNGFQVYDEDET